MRGSGGKGDDVSIVWFLWSVVLCALWIVPHTAPAAGHSDGIFDYVFSVGGQRVTQWEVSEERRLSSIYRWSSETRKWTKLDVELPAMLQNCHAFVIDDKVHIIGSFEWGDHDWTLPLSDFMSDAADFELNEITEFDVE